MFRNRDPQIIVEGEYKQLEKSDVIVFQLNLALIQLCFIVTVPPEGETRAPVYVKFRIRLAQPHGRPQDRPQERNDRRPVTQQRFNGNRNREDSEEVVVE
jgi:hypothetical protein